MKKSWIAFLIAGLFVLNSCENNDNNVLQTTTGTGGSLARFTISGDKLYVVDGNNLKTFDINTSSNPTPGNDVKIGIGIETVFPYGNNLFIGASDAMYIFDISNPDQPKQLSKYTHFLSCDPVVVQGKYAYVTLRSNNCQYTQRDALEVIDISDLKNPKAVTSYTMTSPYGLGIIDTSLFVCQGNYGLSIYNTKNTPNLSSLYNVLDLKPYDVIPLKETLLIIGSDGLFQYDYSDLSNLKLLSKIPVN